MLIGQDDNQISHPISINDAWTYFSNCHGTEHPVRTIEELADAIQGWGLYYDHRSSDEEWLDFWKDLYLDEEWMWWNDK